jgi:fructose-1,6-bisphosphatase I
MSSQPDTVSARSSDSGPRPSLNTHLLQQSVPDDLRHLINDIARSGKYVHNAIRTTDLGLAGTENVFGDKRLKLDELSNEIVRRHLDESRLVYSYASEEEAAWNVLDDSGSFTVVCDPLDGSSLVDANLAIGSIFGVYPRGRMEGRTPRDQLAALYLVYGARTILVYCCGRGVHEFFLDEVGEFVLLKEHLHLGNDTGAKTYAPGNLRAVVDHKNYLAMMNDWLERGLTLRYSGGMVPDVHHMLTKGNGIFTNVGSAKHPAKLRLVFECGPLAYIAEQAGGASSDGQKSILDIPITGPAQRSAIIVGSKSEVECVVATLAGMPNKSAPPKG